MLEPVMASAASVSCSKRKLIEILCRLCSYLHINSCFFYGFSNLFKKNSNQRCFFV